MSESPAVFPPLPLEDWEQTKHTLHLFLQIVGKLRLVTHPKINHWWHVTLFVSTQGLTTGPIPYQDLLFEIEFNFLEHVLTVRTSAGQARKVPLRKLSVADFYKQHFLGAGRPVDRRPDQAGSVRRSFQHHPFRKRHGAQSL